MVLHTKPSSIPLYFLVFSLLDDRYDISYLAELRHSPCQPAFGWRAELRSASTLDSSGPEARAPLRG